MWNVYTMMKSKSCCLSCEKRYRSKKSRYRTEHPADAGDLRSLQEEAAWFAKAAGCNIRIQVLTDRSAMIRMQTDRIHFLSDGETDREEKEILQKLLQEAEYVHMGTDKREEKTVLLLEFGFDISRE